MAVANVQDGRLNLDLVKTIHASAAEIERYKLLPSDLLLTEGGDPDKLGRGTIWNGEINPCIHQNHIFRVRANSALIDMSFLSRLAASPGGKAYFLSKAKQTTGIASINLTQLRSFPVPLPPLNEQRRIAAKLDTTLAAVDACRQRLDGVAAILKRFRQAVLAAATSGELTREWREERGVEKHWLATCLSDIAEIQGGLTKDSKKQDPEDPELPYLRVANVQRGYLDLQEIVFIRVPRKRLGALLLKEGDILFNEGGDRDKVGRGWIWEGQITECVFQNHVFRARLLNQGNQPKYVSWWANTCGAPHFLGQGKQTTNLASISKTTLGLLPIQLPCAAEQEEIVRHVEILFTLADQLEARLTAARKVVDRLTPALLAKAFRGELVPQDPADEPASVLLARIRAARQAEAGAARPSRRGRPKAAANPEPIDRTAAPAPSDPLPPDLLSQLLRECGALSERALLAASELGPEGFFTQLERELQLGLIRQSRGEGQVLLEAVA
jgi:type I restriction enzyme S subunit